MRTNIPPIREPFFEAYVELPNSNPNLPPIKLPIKFNGTTRPWSEWANNLARQSNTGAESELEDLFSAISPEPSRVDPSEADLFGSAQPCKSPGPSEADLFGSIPVPRQAMSLARHFLFMGG